MGPLSEYNLRLKMKKSRYSRSSVTEVSTEFLIEEVKLRKVFRRKHKPSPVGAYGLP